MPSVFRNDVVTFFLENKTTVSGVLYPPSPRLQCYVRKKNYNVESKGFFCENFFILVRIFPERKSLQSWLPPVHPSIVYFVLCPQD